VEEDTRTDTSETVTEAKAVSTKTEDANCRRKHGDNSNE
jgi:hypothetical protein